MGVKASISEAWLLSHWRCRLSGGAVTGAGCTQLIADTIKWAGNSNFAINCKGYGTKPFGPAGVRLVS